MTLFVLDIDGTLADATRRMQKAGPEPKREGNLDAYNEWLSKVQNHISLMNDKPVDGMVCFANALHKYGPTIYLTAREETYRETTRYWLDLHGFPMADLVMRPPGNLEESGPLKEKIIRMALPTYNCTAAVVVDDDGRGDIEQVCKKNGWAFLKARSGGQV
jgi:hypothetical protein